jgi:nicotinate-nucleotide adenylyltransferase
MNPDFQKVNVILGGTFDPPHLGHDQMLDSLIKDHRVNTVFVVPAYQNPLKNYASVDDSGKCLGNPPDRLRWVNTWVNARLKESNLETKAVVENLEIENPNPSYTVDTLAKLQKKHPSQKWVLAVGSDQIPAFDRWKDFSNLMQRLESVWVFKRGDNLSWEKLLSHAPSLLWDKTSLRLMSVSVVEVSSTEVRSAIRKKDFEFLKRVLRPEIFKDLVDFHS